MDRENSNRVMGAGWAVLNCEWGKVIPKEGTPQLSTTNLQPNIWRTTTYQLVAMRSYVRMLLRTSLAACRLACSHIGTWLDEASVQKYEVVTDGLVVEKPSTVAGGRS